jgi:hypothetical protein
VIVDPAFPLKVSYDDLKGSHTVRAEGDLNGGGELLKLRTVAGNIRFVLSDANTQMEMSRQQMQQLQQQTQQEEHKHSHDRGQKQDQPDDDNE